MGKESKKQIAKRNSESRQLPPEVRDIDTQILFLLRKRKEVCQALAVDPVLRDIILSDSVHKNYVYTMRSVARSHGLSHSYIRKILRSMHHLTKEIIQKTTVSDGESVGK